MKEIIAQDSSFKIKVGSLNKWQQVHVLASSWWELLGEGCKDKLLAIEGSL